MTLLLRSFREIDMLCASTTCKRRNLDFLTERQLRENTLTYRAAVAGSPKIKWIAYATILTEVDSLPP